MTSQQNVAIQNPCLVAEQCANARYLTRNYLGGGTWLSVLLTVNVGDE